MTASLTKILCPRCNDDDVEYAHDFCGPRINSANRAAAHCSAMSFSRHTIYLGITDMITQLCATR
jgi:hypothetical protein